MFTQLLATVATAYGVLGAFKTLLQTRQMLARRSSREVSAGFLASYVGGYAIWLAYGPQHDPAKVRTGDTATTPGGRMKLDLFAGIPVTDYAAALPWYERFFGSRPSFLPNDIEAVWEVAEHRYIYIVQEPERAGNALVLSFVDDLDDRVASIAQRGIEPAKLETYDSGATKVIYRDADGNEISFGGALG